MNCDHILDHLTEPSTIRGLAVLVGSIVALVLLARGETAEALQALAIGGVVAGVNGALTSDRMLQREREPAEDDDDPTVY